MNAEKTIKDRWWILNAKRESKLNKSRACSALTVPTLLPYQSLSGEDNLFSDIFIRSIKRSYFTGK